MWILVTVFSPSFPAFLLSKARMFRGSSRLPPLQQARRDKAPELPSALPCITMIKKRPTDSSTTRATSSLCAALFPPHTRGHNGTNFLWLAGGTKTKRSWLWLLHMQHLQALLPRYTSSSRLTKWDVLPGFIPLIYTGRIGSSRVFQTGGEQSCQPCNLLSSNQPMEHAPL